METLVFINCSIKLLFHYFEQHISHGVRLGSDIMPCNKIDRPQVVNR